MDSRVEYASYDANITLNPVIFENHSFKPRVQENILLLTAEYVLHARPDAVWHMDEQFGSDIGRWVYNHA
jgi:hypothetical protein